MGTLVAICIIAGLIYGFCSGVSNAHKASVVKRHNIDAQYQAIMRGRSRR